MEIKEYIEFSIQLELVHNIKYMELISKING